MVTANNESIEIVCKYCRFAYTILANRDDINEWLSGSGYIQDILGYLSPAERELLISGTCDYCWKSMFGDDFDVDEDEE